MFRLIQITWFDILWMYYSSFLPNKNLTKCLAQAFDQRNKKLSKIEFANDA